jgi:hypothetical protein
MTLPYVRYAKRSLQSEAACTSLIMTCVPQPDPGARIPHTGDGYDYQESNVCLFRPLVQKATGTAGSVAPQCDRVGCMWLVAAVSGLFLARSG